MDKRVTCDIGGNKMSFKHQQYAKHLRYTRDDFSKAEREVLMVLADHCNQETNEAWPAISTIAREADLADRTVIRAVDGLERKNILTKVRAVGKRNTVHFPVPLEFDPHKPITADDNKHTPTLDERREAAIQTYYKLTGQTPDNSLEDMYTGSVPGVDDWRECMKIHSELVVNPAYGDTPGQRIINAIIRGKHPAWGGGQ